MSAWSHLRGASQAHRRKAERGQLLFTCKQHPIPRQIQGCENFKPSWKSYTVTSQALAQLMRQELSTSSLKESWGSRCGCETARLMSSARSVTKTADWSVSRRCAWTTSRSPEKQRGVRNVCQTLNHFPVNRQRHRRAHRGVAQVA